MERITAMQYGLLLLPLRGPTYRSSKMNTMEGQGQESTITDERQLQDDDYEWSFKKAEDAIEASKTRPLTNEERQVFIFLLGLDIPNTYTKPLITLE